MSTTVPTYESASDEKLTVQKFLENNKLYLQDMTDDLKTSAQ